MYTIPWFKDIQTELCAYLSTTDKLKLTTHPAKFWLAAMTWFPKLLNITLTSMRVPVNSIAAKQSFRFCSDVLNDDYCSG